MVEIQPRFNDFDIFRHVNNSSYMQYLDLAKVKYFETALGHKVSTDAEIAAVIVNINVNFYSPTYFNEPVVVLTACVRISQHSFTLEQRVVNPETGDVKCAATVVLAAIDPATATSAPLSPEWKAGLARMES
jgi:predicted thioesterase